MKYKKRYPSRIMFLPKELGGRMNPVTASGRYQPTLKVGEEYTSVRVYAQDSTLDVFELGVIYSAYVELVFQDIFAERVDNVKQIILTEGSKVTGVGLFT